ncbi:hypothetical protein RhiirC2_786425 [Rhizophagus irregularis]|uniref:Uncharacterized protein n=1 Tax=Rhizophagus irregularis TaxID=588596 RepID=A0A2N1MUH0_9GLOM|nr:hypothetical protein RhiirC2_786425 [Rhizophagus irregularis]
METLCNELKVKIFRYAFIPIALVLLNRNWYSTFQDPHVRAEWIIYKYGRAHALFHAIRLGNHFVTVEVVQILAKKAIILRYFMQRLMIQFGTYDPKLIKLIEMRSRYNINTDIPKEKPWASELPAKYINSVLRPKDIPAYRSPFGGATENYLSRDGYENNRQVNLISRAILIHPDLVVLWKKIGYNEICSDFNELVIVDTLLVCFPPNPPNNWVCPKDSIKLFESRINVIGESLLNSFHKLRGDSTPPIVESTRFQNG